MQCKTLVQLDAKPKMNDDNDLLDFTDDDSLESHAKPWNVLIVDDDYEIHAVTKFAFLSIDIHGRPINWLDAYTGKEAVEIVKNNNEIHLMILDAFMETDTAGIDCATHIKRDLNRKIPIIVMRSGFAGWEVEAAANENKLDVIDQFILKTDATQAVMKAIFEKWLTVEFQT